MTKKLGRDLGLYAVFTISIGAMIGSGIFVLPGLAETIAGPAVILAYLLAGVIVMPAALSKAEMATAMPEAGGTYLYIDRAMGPLLGTIAGVGAWFSLIFKSAFALAGLGAYLLLFAGDVPTKPVALGLGVLLLAVNVVGVKQTGRLQSIIVTAVLVVLGFFVADGITYVQRVNYHPFYSQGIDGLLAATGFVFVSYAGVTKVASVAEEVENPGRNIPIGILASVGLMMLLYTFIVFVIVGVTAPDQLGKTLTPMAVAAEQFLGTVGTIIIAITAVLALTSMANAGILAASRFPFAMSRDNLAPTALQEINARFRTPAISIGISGILLLLLIAFVPVIDLAKLASAFKILVFSLINVALIAFRESELDWYQPEYRAPGYPWVQIFGILAGMVLITQMGMLPLAGAITIILVGVVWYQLYGRAKTEREGVAVDAIRRRVDDRLLEEAEYAVSQDGTYRILIPLHPDITEERETVLLRIAADLIRGQEGHIEVARLTEVPAQVSLSAVTVQPAGGDQFEERITTLAGSFGIEVECNELVSHDAKRAVVDYARRNNVDLVLGEVEPRHWRIPLFGGEVEWLMDHLPCDSIFVRNRGFDEVRDIAVIGEKGPHDPLEIRVANTLARRHRANVHFLRALKPDATDIQISSIRTYHEELAHLFDTPTESQVIRAEHRVNTIAELVADADLVVVSAFGHQFFRDNIFGDFADRIADQVACTVLMTHTHQRSHVHSAFRYVVERVIHARG